MRKAIAKAIVIGAAIVHAIVSWGVYAVPVHDMLNLWRELHGEHAVIAKP